LDWNKGMFLLSAFATFLLLCDCLGVSHGGIHCGHHQGFIIQVIFLLSVVVGVFIVLFIIVGIFIMTSSLRIVSLRWRKHPSLRLRPLSVIMVVSPLVIIVGVFIAGIFSIGFAIFWLSVIVGVFIVGIIIVGFFIISMG
jgi:hypothetical protein